MMRRLMAFGVVLAMAAAACSPDEPRIAPGDTESTDVPRRQGAPDAVGSGSATPTPPGSSPPEPPQPPPEPTVPAEPPPAAQDPGSLARQITGAERTIRSDAGDAQVAAAGHVQQAAYRHLARSPEWRDEVLALVPPELRGPVIANLEAAVDLGALTTPQPQLPAWRIVAPPPAAELLAHYREAQEVFRVGWEYLAAIHLVETRMGRIRGTSPAGAQGPMQFMPGTWAAYGEGDINDPRDAILAAGRYLSANGAPDNMAGALFAYNRSNAYVRAISAYADQMRTDPRTFNGYYHWQVYYRHVDGDRLLPVGYDGTR